MRIGLCAFGAGYTFGGAILDKPCTTAAQSRTLIDFLAGQENYYEGLHKADLPD